MNGFIPDSESETGYPYFFEVASSILAIGLDQVFFLFLAYTAHTAIFALLVRIGSSTLLLERISLLAREFWLDVALVFGGKSGCRIYNRF